ncbi:MAG: hypothetical protein LH485_02270 [Sphingomonas bacterium]|nr:hypothetical protein [Sphingomonas bacterium]
MRRFLAPTLALLVAACASTPAVKPAAVIGKPTGRPGGALLGLDVHDLGQRFGQPAFQVQEGPGTKLQWAGGGCVLDVYLYPPESGSGLARVTYADARRPSGVDIDVASCLALMGR